MIRRSKKLQINTVDKGDTMEELCQIIIRLFHYVQPQDIINGTVRFDQIETELLKKLYYICEQQSDESENERRIQWIQDRISHALHDRRNQSLQEFQLNIYDLIELFSEEILVCENDEVLCRFEKLQQWRNMTIKVDSNLFVAAKHVSVDRLDGKIRDTFYWKNVIGHNNVTLNRILETGISDNHFHLMGSVYYFDLAWISLMNQMNQKKIVDQLEQLESARRGVTIQYQNDRRLSFGELHLMAALIRTYLFAELSGQFLLPRDELEEMLMKPQANLWRRKIQSFVDWLHKDENIACRDYAMNALGSWHHTDEQNAVTGGEKWFLYQMFWQHSDRYSNLTPYHFQLFYAYLVIKELFRMELLQCNERYGFVNFSQYQKRKRWFTTSFSAGELARTAVKSVFDGQNVLSLELRVKPENTFQEDVKLIEYYDQEISENKLKYYYVFHFAKKKDNGIQRFGTLNYMFCRHSELRAEIKQQAEAILQMRKKNSKVAKRLKGIDACSDEDGCRPEVFATVFRTLKHHSCYQSFGKEAKLPQLRLTYHVGEVFQDILDGLRAIDEAIDFLNLDRGDRMGHATVLGMNPQEWYQQNQYVITIRKQDYLDNVAWLYRKLIRYHYNDEHNLMPYLEKEFYKAFGDVYEKALEKNYIERIIQAACQYDSLYGNMPIDGSLPFEYSIGTYYDSWRLRGDDPELYLMGYYRRSISGGDLWRRYGVNEEWDGEGNLLRVRYSLSAVILNHFYHYNNDVKALGNSSVQVKIPEHMVDAIEFVQKQMQMEIARRKIAIETNPTSNILINRIKIYAQHPIVSFYNKGLVHDPEKLSCCAQLNVSINTDDQGVFSTSLSNEYALMASSLSSLKNENGNYLHHISDIYDWIRRIQEMGNQQAFNFEASRNTSMNRDRYMGYMNREIERWS